MNTIRIATRGSDQARTQAEAVGDALRSAWSDIAIEYVIVSTTGDQKQDVPLHQIGGQGVFVKEVQNAVLDGRADLAVHSAKDLPAATHPELAICAFVRRRDPRDALIGVALNELEQGATVATGSIRRKAQLRLGREDAARIELEAFAFADIDAMEFPILGARERLGQDGHGQARFEAAGAEIPIHLIHPTHVAAAAERQFVAVRAIIGSRFAPVDGEFIEELPRGELDQIIAHVADGTNKSDSFSPQRFKNGRKFFQRQQRHRRNSGQTEKSNAFGPRRR